MIVDDPSNAADRSVSLEAAFEENFDDLYRFAVRRVGESPAEDAVAETFARAVSRYPSFDSERGSVRAWLFGIETNVLREVLRARSRERRPVPEARAGTEWEREVEGVETALELRSALDGLPRRSVELLLLVDGFALSYREAATAIGIPVGTVRSGLSIARRRLRRALGSGSSQRGTT
ncbi:MAG TPA: RNA polymerase sigma factor [Acidimicrobiales bacterium]|nr:RNA polymerase sigma factor [Acidimicrobiales bacterium]